jgi:predicted small secreted protein
MKRLLSIAAVIASTLAFVGCNTVQGAGKDIERGGEKIQDAAQDVKKKM